MRCTQLARTVVMGVPLKGRYATAVEGDIFVVARADAEPSISVPLPRVSVWLDDVPIEAALNALFRAGAGRYRLEAGKSTRVTVRLRNVSFEGALCTILRAAYDESAILVEWDGSGVWNIRMRD